MPGSEPPPRDPPRPDLTVFPPEPAGPAHARSHPAPPRPDLDLEGGPPPDVFPYLPPVPPYPAPVARPTRRRRRVVRWVPAAVVLLIVAAAFVADARVVEQPHDTLITDDRSGGTYERADGQPSAITDLCATSRLLQTEPAVAVDPRDPDVVVVGANDDCGARFGTSWPGFYRSADGGETWTRSLVPGFAQDFSDDGRRSPAHKGCDGASDPTLAFDRKGTLYYAFICSGADLLGHPSMFMARYADDGGDYRGTVTVRPLEPTTGFEDKPAIAVDTTGGRHDGDVYAAWTDFAGFQGRVEFCTAVYFARSTDGGVSFQRAVKISGPECATFVDVAVGPRGSVYATFQDGDKLLVTASNDGGATFGNLVRAATIRPYSGGHFQIGEEQCGDGPDECPNGMTFPRVHSIPALAVDAAGLHLAWASLDAVGRARVYVKNSADGRTWDRAAVLVHPSPVGHQWLPDIATDGEHLDVIWLDSRDDPAFEPNLPPGVSHDGRNSGDVVNTMLARSTDGGRTWTEQRLSSHPSNPNWEVQDFARVPFYGDYMSVSIADGRGFAVWPDSRDLVPGRDSRESGDDDDHDGFDGYLPCGWIPDNIDADAYSQAVSTCITRGGLDLNVYGASFDP